MRNREMVRLKAVLGKLTRGQRKTLTSILESRTVSTETVEGQMPVQSACSHCTRRLAVKNGSAHGLQRFKCRNCCKTFNALTGTHLSGLHMRGKWLGQAEAMCDELSLNQTADRLNIAQSTAFCWCHRFLVLPKIVQTRQLAGLVEADETYFFTPAKGNADSRAKHDVVAAKLASAVPQGTDSGADRPRPRWHHRQFHSRGDDRRGYPYGLEAAAA